MTDRELMQRLLPAMERACSYYDLYEECDLVRERLAQPEQEHIIDCLRCGHCCPQPEQEPVAWVNQANLNSAAIQRNRGGQGDTHTWSETPNAFHPIPLYTIPPQRQWQGLTADEIWDEWLQQTEPERDTRNFVAAYARAIEAKLREKNT